MGASGADVRLCSEPVLGGSSCLAWGGGPGGSALGSWPHRLDCMSVGGEWVLEIPGPCPVSGPALTWC